MAARDVLARRDDRRPRAHRAHERVDDARSRAAGQEPRRQGHLRGDAASLHADRRSARDAGRLRHQHQDEPAAARGARPRRHARRHRRRQRRRDRDRSRAASLRREERRVRPRAVRHRRAGNGGAARARSAGAHRRHQAAAARRADVGQSRRASCACRAARCAEGRSADITILAPDLAVTIDRARLRSRSKNTPFHGWTLRGGVAATIVGGRVVYANPDLPFIKEARVARRSLRDPAKHGRRANRASRARDCAI